MKSIKNGTKKNLQPIGSDFFERLWKESWTYIKTVVDVVREPVLILDKNFRVMAANEPFYRTFQVGQKDTEGKIIYELGNGQWDIPSLHNLLEDILPKDTFFKGFEVSHKFPFIGRKVMLLNGRQIHFSGDAEFQPIILLAIEDVTEMMIVAENMADHTNKLETELKDRTQKLEAHMKELQKQIDKLENNS